MTAAPVDTQDERRAHLLGGRAEVEGPAADDHAVACALVDGVLGPDRLGVLAAEPGEPEVRVGADLLVGRGREDQVAARTEPLAGERRNRDRTRRHLAFHVERAAAPDVTVAELARPWVHGPLGRVGEHRVRVRQEEEPRPAAASGDARDEARPLRHARVELALDPERLQVVAQQLGGDRLVAGRIDGVEADQLLEELHDLVAQGLRRHYVRRPIVNR